MGERDLPPAVARVIADHIASVAQLEMLLLLRARPGEALSPAAVGRVLGIDPAWAGSELHELALQGLLVEQPDPEARYRFGPRTPELAAALDALADAYAHRRVSVVTAICARPAATIRVFSDAFRLRKD